MASVISHAAAAAAVSIAFAPAGTPGRFWPIAIATAIVPDTDLLLFYFRLSYHHALGHRGFFHSPFFGLIVSLILMVVFFRDQTPFSGRWLHYFFLLFVIWTSHGILDALTNGGRGVVFLFPFSSRRYFFPWTPIQVAPIGVKSFFSSWGWSVLKSEFVWIWLPGLTVVCLSRVVRLWRGWGHL